MPTIGVVEVHLSLGDYVAPINGDLNGYCDSLRFGLDNRYNRNNTLSWGTPASIHYLPSRKTVDFAAK